LLSYRATPKLLCDERDSSSKLTVLTEPLRNEDEVEDVGIDVVEVVVEGGGRKLLGTLAGCTDMTSLQNRSE
jgi:hypothetical protein